MGSDVYLVHYNFKIAQLLYKNVIVTSVQCIREILIQQIIAVVCLIWKKNILKLLVY